MNKTESVILDVVAMCEAHGAAFSYISYRNWGYGEEPLRLSVEITPSNTNTKIELSFKGSSVHELLEKFLGKIIELETKTVLEGGNHE